VTHQIPVQGYTTLLIVMCFFSGIILFSLGVIAQYLALFLATTMGRPGGTVDGPNRRPPLERFVMRDRRTGAPPPR